ncbi:MAG: tyrosine-type recombinase/integrase [Beijerinckiaceae bacterium]|nr:tyrosine-type recombinase/integrase [Beijerinckiaceae bacterium]
MNTMLGGRAVPIVRLRGVSKATAKLADGRRVTYWYAWRGGPRLDGEPGSPEFMASYNRAVAGRHGAAEGSILHTSRQYRVSAEFGKLGDKSQRAYLRYLTLIENEFGDMPLAALDDRRARGDFLAWRDTMKDRPRTADYAWTVLSRLFSWAKGRGLIHANPCERAGRLYESDRAESLWSDVEFERLFAACSAQVRWVVQLAVLTGQRQGDLLRLTWNRIVDGEIRMRQSKRGRRVTLEIYPELAAVLAEIPRRSTTILTNTAGQPWTEDGFRASFNKARARGAIMDRTFHDIRGTAVTHFAMRGMTAIEIAALAGWTEKDVSELLDRHYLGARADLARAAVRRCLGNETSSDFAKRLQNGRPGRAVGGVAPITK